MTSGLSLAISSANRLTPNSTRKIHSDQKPRRLARKLRSRRRISGVSRTPSRRSAGADGATGSRAAVPALDIPAFKIDPRIGDDIHEVADQVEEQAEQGEEIQRAEHHRVVAIDRRFEAQQAEPVERE